MSNVTKEVESQSDSASSPAQSFSKRTMRSRLKRVLIALAVLVALFSVLVWSLVSTPADVEEMGAEEIRSQPLEYLDFDTSIPADEVATAKGQFRRDFVCGPAETTKDPSLADIESDYEPTAEDMEAGAAWDERYEEYDIENPIEFPEEAYEADTYCYVHVTWVAEGETGEQT